MLPKSEEAHNAGTHNSELTNGGVPSKNKPADEAVRFEDFAQNVTKHKWKKIQGQATSTERNCKCQ